MAETRQAGAADSDAPPAANRAVVAGELKRALASKHRNRRATVLLLRAAPEWHDGDAAFDADVGGVRVPVTVVPCSTVLAVLAALAGRTADREPGRADGRYLVILTPQEGSELGDSVLARALLPMVKPVNRWDLVLDAFGARLIDPELTRTKSAWIAEALLAVQPRDGWQRVPGEVLTRATALNRLAAARLGIGAVDDSPVDPAALLQWTTKAADVARFFALRDTERTGLTDWLTEPGDPIAEVVFAMAEADKATDAVPLGLVVAALGEGDKATASREAGPGEALIARVRVEERYLGGKRVAPGRLRVFGEAAESLVTRWADNGHADEAARLCDRAEEILAEIGGSQEAARRLGKNSGVLAVGREARLTTFANMLAAMLANSVLAGSALADSVVDPSWLGEAEDAFRRLKVHTRAFDDAVQSRAAEAALRVARWLGSPEDPPATVADAATRALRSWAWADRALADLTREAAGGRPQLAQAYDTLRDRALARRARLDAEFAHLLAARAAGAGGTALSDDPIQFEHVLDRIARPVAERRAPVIIALIGMTATVGLRLAEAATSRGAWVEVGRRADGREPVLASAAAAVGDSLASLLTGTRMPGGGADERAGFTAFWGRRKSALFNLKDLAAAAAAVPVSVQESPAQVRAALLDADQVVGVVLEADAEVSDVTRLLTVMTEARRAGRPVILTFPAEAVAPVVTLFPAGVPLPADWYAYDTVGHAPGWWDAPPVRRPQAQPTEPPTGQDKQGKGRGKRRPVAQDAGDALFGLMDVLSPAGEQATKQAGPQASPQAGAESDRAGARDSLGARVVASSRMAAQRRFIRRAPADSSVTALIDALAAGGGRLTLAEAAAAAGEPAVRMSGYLAQIIRLLNVDGYAVLQTKDDGRTVELNSELLRQQFLAG